MKTVATHKKTHKQKMLFYLKEKDTLRNTTRISIANLLNICILPPPTAHSLSYHSEQFLAERRRQYKVPHPVLTLSINHRVPFNNHFFWMRNAAPGRDWCKEMRGCLSNYNIEEEEG